jgi:hypothetical protein
MANTVLTPAMITNEALRVLHEKLNFVGSINHQYDDSFAKSGAKIGDTLKIRLPNQYTVRSGATLNTQDTVENYVSLQQATQKGVDLNFSSVELTLSLDDFSKRVLQPAMSSLGAAIEADALSMYKDVYNQVNNISSTATMAKMLATRKVLVDNLCPPGERKLLLNTQDNADLVEALKGLYQDDKELGKQYRDGYMGRAAGFDISESTYLTTHTPGSEVAAASSTISINGSNQVSTNSTDDTVTLTVTNGSSKTLLAGDIVTLVGVNRVHPETKVDTGALQQFTVDTDLSSSGTSLVLRPGIVISGPRQNVTAAPTTANAIKKIGVASTAYGMSLAYHKDAFAIAFADLVMPGGVDFSARKVFDGISMRIVRQYDINNDKYPCRLDVYYGYKPIRPQLACRFANN